MDFVLAVLALAVLIAFALTWLIPVGLPASGSLRKNVAVSLFRGAIRVVPRIAGAAFEVLQANLPAVAAAAGTTVPAELGSVPTSESQANFQVQKITVVAPTLVTGNNTNSGTLNIRQMRAGVAIATLGTLALVTGVNLAAEVGVNIPITGNPVLLAGDQIDVQYVQIGTGLALPAGTEVSVEIA